MAYPQRGRDLAGSVGLAICGLVLIGSAFAAWVDLRSVLQQFGAPLYDRSFVWSGIRLGEGWVCLGAGVMLLVVTGIGRLRPQTSSLAFLACAPAAAAAAAIGVAINSAPSNGVTAWPWVTLAVAVVAGATPGLAQPQPTSRWIGFAAAGMALVAAAFVVGHLFHHSLASGRVPIVN